MSQRDHIFISYATEDGVLAEWLARRLTAEDYKVWIDLFELLGGEPYPQDIDAAIKTTAFRVVHLVSRHSLNKPNPVKERTLALNLGRERGENFLIPLNVDGLGATELNWMLSDLTYIPFTRSWAQGLKQLLKLLKRLGAPKTAVNGRQLAASTFLQDDVLRHSEETLYSNLLPILSTPDVIHRFDLSRPVSSRTLEPVWPHYMKRDIEGLHRRASALAFHEPPELGVPNLNITKQGGALWQEADEVFGLESWQVAKPLLRKVLHAGCLERGLILSENRKYLYFPRRLLENDRISFLSYTGKRVSIKVAGLRTFRGQDQFRYNLGFTFDILRLPPDQLVAKLRIRLRVTDIEDNRLPRVSAQARRKWITKAWFNHQILSRQFAILSFLSDGAELLEFGDAAPLTLSTKPLTFVSDIGIDEEAINKRASANLENAPESYEDGDEDE